MVCFFFIDECWLVSGKWCGGKVEEFLLVDWIFIVLWSLLGVLNSVCLLWNWIC